MRCQLSMDVLLKMTGWIHKIVYSDNHSNSYENMHVFLYSLLCMVIFQAKGRNIFDQVSRKCVIYQQSEQDEKALD